MRRRTRTDRNQAEIVDTLRSHGVSVVCLSSVGGGVPDLLCGLPDRRNVLLEVKNLEGRGARMTDAETRFLDTWPGACHVVFSAEQALAVLGLEPEVYW